jgi:hypothetical protein
MVVSSLRAAVSERSPRAAEKQVTYHAEQRALIEHLQARYLFALDFKDHGLYVTTFTPTAFSTCATARSSDANDARSGRRSGGECVSREPALHGTRTVCSDADKLMRCVADFTQGFGLLMAGKKASLEPGTQLNPTRDR